MKISLLAALLLCSAGAANAITFSSALGANDPGLSAGQSMVDPFESGNLGPAGIVYGGSYTVDNLAVSGIRAAPAGDISNYFATPGSLQSLPGVATIDFSGYIAANRSLRSLSFYWGSIDSYNTLEVLDNSNHVIRTITGDQMNNPADGNQTTAAANRRIFIRFDDTDNFASLRLTSTQRAFEIDDVGASFVPEPATWAMLVGGMGLVGITMRRRRYSPQFNN